MTTDIAVLPSSREREASAIDLNELLVTNPPATYYMRMRGNQLARRGILPEDLLVVDRSRPPVAGCIVVFRQEGEFTCRELIRGGDSYLLADDEGNQLPLSEDTEIFGTVSGVVRKL